MKTKTTLYTLLAIAALLGIVLPLLSLTQEMPTGFDQPDLKNNQNPGQLTSTSTPTPALPPSTRTATPEPSRTATATPTATTTLGPAWIYHLPGPLVAPILLYHHIADTEEPDRYAIAPSRFQSQMELLKTWGYSTVTVAVLVEVINEGGFLPERPIIITFDDANLDVYENAFPLMKSLDLIGSVYVIADTLSPQNGVYNINVNQLRELADAGWEIGSHSMSHTNLVEAKRRLGEELKGSKELLEEQTGLPIMSVAFPFGLADQHVRKTAQDYGYIAGLGLGVSTVHGLDDLYYLDRIEVESQYDLEKFGSLLPWKGPLEEGVILPEIYVFETPETPAP